MVNIFSNLIQGLKSEILSQAQNDNKGVEL